MLKVEKNPPTSTPTGHATRTDIVLYRVAATYTVVISTFLAVWLGVKPVSHDTLFHVSDLVWCIGPLLLVPPCFRGLWRTRREQLVRMEPQQWVPTVLGLSILAFSIDRGVSAYSHMALHRTLPFPSAADVIYLGAYPMLLLGILLLAGKQLTAASRTRMLLDILLFLVGVAAFSWYFLVGPSIVAQHSSVLARVVNIAYPVADLSLISCMVWLWTVLRQTSRQRVPMLLGLGVLVLIGTDSLREYQILHEMYASGTLLDLGRPVAYMIFGLAALAVRATASERAESERIASVAARMPRAIPRVWRYLLPYAAVPTVVGLMIYIVRAPGYSPLAIGVYCACALLIELVFLHQFMDYRELTAFSNRNARLESLAAADPVTGLPNHRTVVTALDLEFARARRYHHPCAVLFLDLDHFKALNDSYGHPSGDAALREFASVVRTALRGVDILGRWGGEEFVAMLPETGTEAALMVAERVRSAVASHTFWSAGGAHVSCSVGVATYPENADNRDDLIEMADRAMYAAKRLGRNQVRTAGEPAVAALAANIRTSGAHEEAALFGTVEALAALVEARDLTVGEHITDIAALASKLALEMGLDTSEAQMAGLAGRLHDIGKVAIPEAVLTKPGRLSDDEWTLIRKHPIVSASVVSRVPALRVLSPIIRAHHEHWNGTGYPDRLAGDAIPVCARILAVAAAYAAITADRPYRGTRSLQKALIEIEQSAGTQFDPEVTEALRRILETEAGSSSVA